MGTTSAVRGGGAGGRWSLGVLLMLVLAGCTGGEAVTGADAAVAGAGVAQSPSSSTGPATQPDLPAEAPEQVLAERDLVVTDRKDGDSFDASDGEEYRVGLINTPERGTCGGEEAADRTYALLADGFASEIYARDTYGRAVARIMTSEGDLGVILAEEGLADDRYLDDFRDENPAYAAELDGAFDRARRDGVGLYATCWGEADTAQRMPPSSDEATTTHVGDGRGHPCHPAYLECLPDGPDLDCAEVGHQVRLLGRDDPFRLDGNSLTATDGVGCDTYEPWTPTGRYAYAG